MPLVSLPTKNGYHPHPFPFVFVFPFLFSNFLTLFFVKYLFPNSLVNLCADHVFWFGQFSLFNMATFFSSLVEWYNEKRLNCIYFLVNYGYGVIIALFLAMDFWICVAYGKVVYVQASDPFWEEGFRRGKQKKFLKVRLRESLKVLIWL